MANVDIRLGHKDTAWFTVNPTLVLKDGQMVVCSDGSNIGKYKIGDGTTQLSSLTFYGGVSTSPAWGVITGTLSNQTDLQNALNAKQNLITTGTTLEYFRGDLSLATFPTNISSFNNDSGYITNSALSPYLTSANAALTYEPIFSKNTAFNKNFGTGTTNIVEIGSTLGNSLLTSTDANGKLQTLTTSTYPSLTELSYVKGVTSAIQTQINNKYDASNPSGYITSSSLSPYLTSANAALTYQPLDADLTSWAAITRASGFDTFVATPSSANLLSLLTDKTGNGVNVFGTSPTFTTDITTPKIIGGSAVGSGIQYKGTTANGTTTAIAHEFLVGNNGGTSAISINNNGFIGFGIAPDATYKYVFSSSVKLQSSALAFLGDIYNNIGNTSTGMYRTTGVWQYGGSQQFSIYDGGTNVNPNFLFTTLGNTSQTASTNIPNFRVNGSTKTWAAGALTNQYWNYFTANTAAFASASTITNSYGLFVEAATAGTNATITNNYAAGFSGRVGQYGLGNSTYFGDLCGVKDDITNRQNTAFGAQAANKVASGSLNIAMGYQSLFTNVSGNNNVAIGGFTLYQATSNSNIAVGGYALYNLTSGQNNVALGYNTGGGVTIGANNIFIGNNITGLASSLSNNIILATNGGVERFRYNPSQGSQSLFSFSPESTTGNLASTEINIFRVNAATTTISTGALTTQRFTYLPSQTLAFAGASTATNVYGLYVEAATAGTNATITNNYAAGFNGGNGIQVNPGSLANQGLVIRDQVGTAATAAIYMCVTPSATNYTIISDGTSAKLNATSGVGLAVSGTTYISAALGATLNIADTVDFVFSTSTGTKFGKGTTQKLAFWNATPIVQPTTSVTAATRVSVAGNTVTDADTFDGYTVGQIVKALRNTGLLA